jgi:hypothetical protein
MFVFGLFLISSLPATIVAVVLYIVHRKKCRESFIPVPIYALLLLGCGGGGYLLALAYGFDWACAPPAKNLCGLTVTFIIGPLATSIPILLVAIFTVCLPRDRDRSDAVARRTAQSGDSENPNRQ